MSQLAGFVLRELNDKECQMKNQDRMPTEQWDKEFLEQNPEEVVEGRDEVTMKNLVKGIQSLEEAKEAEKDNSKGH